MTKKGFKHSEETRIKMSKSKMGHITTEETKRKLSETKIGEKNPNYGNKHLSKGTEFKNGKDNPNYKIPWTEERRRNLSGKNHYLYGEHLPKETRRKMGESHKKLIGEKSCNWQGGISFEPYTPDFNGNFRRKIRKRDNYYCMVCGKPQKELKRQLAIHHVDYNKLNSFPQNCISLCVSCHMKTNTNRIAWTVFFQKLLKEKYSYQYTQDQKIIIDFME